MLARITPSPLKGTVPAIASKSMAHRLIICAALANGETHVTCNTTCADIEATVRCLTALGARIETVEDGFQVHPTMKSVEFGLLKALAGGTLDCGESGSTLRFMLPVACALGAEATFVGQGRLGARPLSPLSDEIIAAGCDLQGLGGFPLKTSGRMRPGTFVLPGNVSSQYISGLLLAAPLLAQPSCVQVTGLIESRPYINLTLQLMRDFGAQADWVSEDCITVSPGGYTDTPFTVESDWSAASYWYQMMAIEGIKNEKIKGGDRSSAKESEDSTKEEAHTAEIELLGLFAHSYQGDSRGAEVFTRLGVHTEYTDRGVKLTRKGTPATRLDEDMVDIPDLAQTFVVTCCLMDIPFRFTGLQSLKIKETDRITALITELRKLGYVVRSEQDSILLWDGERCPADADPVIATYEDHRMAMAFAPACLVLPQIRINEPQVVTKSYPAYWEDLQKAGFKVCQDAMQS